MGSFLYGGKSSTPILGYANLWNIPPHISKTGDLSQTVPVNKIIDCIGSNGEYWLIGFRDETLYKFDGVNWTKLLEGETDYRCEAIKWNGSYWLILYRYSNDNRLYKYNGVSVTLAESLIGNALYDLAWSPTVELWIIVGDSYALPTHGVAWTWNGLTLTDITDKVSEADDISFKAAEWFESYWLLGGRHSVHYKQLKKYNPVTETVEYIIPPRPPGDTSGRISCMKAGGGIALVGERYELGGYQTLYKWDGEKITVLKLFNFHRGGLTAIDYSEGLFFLVGTDVVKNYKLYFDPKIRTYNPAENMVEKIYPPWETGSLYATAYTSKVF